MDAEEPIPASDTLPAPARWFVVGVVLVGSALVSHSAIALATNGLTPLCIFLLGMTVIAGLATLEIPAMPIRFSISDTFSIIAALVVGPAAGAVIAAVDGLVGSCRISKNNRAFHRVMFNTATPAVATWLAAQLFFLLAGDRPLMDGPAGALRLLLLLSVFGVVDFALISGMVAVAVALERGTAVLSVWRSHFSGLWITYLGGVFAAMLLIAIGNIGTLEGLILLAPLPVILYVTSRHAQGRAQDQIHHLGKMNRVYVAAIEALAQAVDTKDQVTHDHTRRVQKNAVRLAQALGVTDDMEIQAVRAAALLHDVGKIGVPEHILNKPGRLSRSEFEIMKQHAPMGAEILSVIGFPYPVVPIVRHHHENWDGSGYPDGLSGEQIPIGARILAVVDCFDALTSDRPYRPRLADGEALKIVADRRGNMYDPRVVDAFFLQRAEDTGEALMQLAPAMGTTAKPRLADGEPSVHDGAMASGRLFYDIGRDLPKWPSAHDLGETLWKHLSARVPASAFVLYAYQTEHDAIVPVFASAAGIVEPHVRVPLGERLSGWVAANGRTILNSDARLDVDECLRAESTLRSALAVRASTGDRTVGVLTFYSDRGDAFTAEHSRLIEEAAHVVAATGIDVGSLDSKTVTVAA